MQQFIFIRRSLIRYYEALNVILALMKTGAGVVTGGLLGFEPPFLLTPRHKAHQNIFNEINSRTSIVKTMCRCVLNVINVNLKPTFTIFLHVIVKRVTPMVPTFCLSPLPLISPYTGHDR